MILNCAQKKKFTRCKSQDHKCKSSSDLPRSKYKIQKVLNLVMCSDVPLCIKYMNRLSGIICYNSFNKCECEKKENRRYSASTY